MKHLSKRLLMALLWVGVATVSVPRPIQAVPVDDEKFTAAQKDDYAKRLRDRERMVREESEFKKKMRDRVDEEARSLEAYAAQLHERAESVESASAERWPDERRESDRLLADTSEPKPLMVSPLEKKWDTVKGEYRDKFAKALAELNDQITSLKNERDYGDPKRRDQIAEQLSDLNRAKARMQQRTDELRAATAINWMNLRSRITDAIEDMKD